MTTANTNFDERIGQVVRNGKAIYYAYINNVLVERNGYSEVLDALKLAAKEAAAKEAASKRQYEAGDTFTEHINQGDRDCTVIAVLGDKYLFEYTMPAGTSAINNERHKAVSYKSLSDKWLLAIEEQFGLSNLVAWPQGGGMGWKMEIRKQLETRLADAQRKAQRMTSADVAREKAQERLNAVPFDPALSPVINDYLRYCYWSVNAKSHDVREKNRKQATLTLSSMTSDAAQIAVTEETKRNLLKW
jgi:hypothetical protein